MPPGPAGASVDEELQTHYRAYLQLFQAILKKRQLAPEQERVHLQRLRQYLLANVKNIDQFVDHIPDFARALGVSADALGAYVGANLLKVLERVRQQVRESRASAAPPPRAAPSPAASAGGSQSNSIIAEILATVGSVVEAPARFESLDMGALKLVKPDGEVLSAHHEVAASGQSPSGETAPGPAASTTTVTGKKESPARTAAPPASVAPAVAETSIIEEILKKCGSVLAVSGKLEPDVMPPGGVDDGETGEAPAAPDPGSAASAPETAKAAPAAPAAPRGPEPSIIEEILKKCGNALTVPGKLEPESGPGADSGEGPTTKSVEQETEAEEADDEEDFEPIPFSFEDYGRIVASLQGFQKSGDRAAYQNWLSENAGLAGRLVVALRNLEGRERKGQTVQWPDEYYNLGHSLQLERAQVADLHRSLRVYDRMQQVLNRFIQTARSGDPQLLGALRKIWPQIRLLFNDADDEDGMVSRLKIPLLQVPDAALRERIIEEMRPVFSRIHQIHAAAST